MLIFFKFYIISNLDFTFPYPNSSYYKGWPFHMLGCRIWLFFGNYMLLFKPKLVRRVRYLRPVETLRQFKKNAISYLWNRTRDLVRQNIRSYSRCPMWPNCWYLMSNKKLMPQFITFGWPVRVPIWCHSVASRVSYIVYGSCYYTLWKRQSKSA